MIRFNAEKYSTLEKEKKQDNKLFNHLCKQKIYRTHGHRAFTGKTAVKE